MKLCKTKNGRIKLADTLMSMEVGENWKLLPDTFSHGYLKVFACNYGKAVGKSFSVSHPSESRYITITRNK